MTKINSNWKIIKKNLGLYNQAIQADMSPSCVLVNSLLYKHININKIERISIVIKGQKKNIKKIKKWRHICR